MITPDDASPSPQYTHLFTLIESIRKKTNELEAVWQKRRLRVELFVQIKHFEIHSREVSSIPLSIAYDGRVVMSTRETGVQAHSFDLSR